MLQVAFVDLDDTLFSSLHKQNGSQALEPAALLQDGSIISYASPQQRALTKWIRESDLVIPVTARTAEAFHRVLLKFSGYAVVSHGATILASDHSPDPYWSERIDQGLCLELPVLSSLMDLLESQHGGEGGLYVRMTGEPNRPAYLMAKDPGKDPAAVLRASEFCVTPWIKAHPDYTHHVNGNNLAVLPPSIGKRAAVAYIIELLQKEHGELFVVGAGDSLTDAPFLSLCHAALIPTRSQVWDVVQSIARGNRC